MNISFEGPTFFTKEDEDQFFSWLYALPAYKAIAGAGRTLHLQLSAPVDTSTVEQLLVIFRRWCIDTSALLPLRTPETVHLALWDTELKEASRFEL